MTTPEISAYLRALPERPPAPTTAEIVETLRREALGGYCDLRALWHQGESWRYGQHLYADALRRAAKRLARLEDGWTQVPRTTRYEWFDCTVSVWCACGQATLGLSEEERQCEHCGRWYRLRSYVETRAALGVRQ